MVGRQRPCWPEEGVLHCLGPGCRGAAALRPQLSKTISPRDCAAREALPQPESLNDGSEVLTQVPCLPWARLLRPRDLADNPLFKQR